MISEMPRALKVVPLKCKDATCSTERDYVASSKDLLKRLWRDLLALESDESNRDTRGRIAQRLEALERDSRAEGFADIEAVGAGLRQILLGSDTGTRQGCAAQLWEGLELLSVFIYESERQLQARLSGDS